LIVGLKPSSPPSLYYLFSLKEAGRGRGKNSEQTSAKLLLFPPPTPFIIETFSQINIISRFFPSLSEAFKNTVVRSSRGAPPPNPS